MTGEARGLDKSQETMLATMRQRLRMAEAAFSDSREDELDDLRFFAGSPDNQWQWPMDVLSTRGSVQGQTINARPCLTINKLPQHVRQVTNEQRQNRPSGKVIPVDDNADIEVAEIYEGMVRHIEYISDADVAYDTACENQVTYGEGYIRLLTEYCREDSFDQDIKIGRIRNAFSVYMDPTIQDPCGSDAEWCFITQDMTKDEYEREFPDALPVTGLQDQGVGDESIGAWIQQDTVRVAEYFYYEYKADTLNLYASGQTAFTSDRNNKLIELAQGAPIKTREVQRKRVMWVKTNGFEVLESREWPGKWIPVVRVVGNEFEVEGRVWLSGLVRNAKDAQRMYNYWTSQEAEMLALAPKAPFVGYGGQFEGYETQWKTANTNNWPYLEVNPDVTDAQGGPLPLPQRAAPPLPQSGLWQAKMGASDDIKGTTGQYDASLGAQSNEQSGKAILARERQGDVGTYHYVDNLARAIRHITRQLIDLIPKIYDTQRIARIIGVDDEVKMVKINPAQLEPVREVKNEAGIVIEKIYNPGVGTYDVMVTTGPSYMTKRQEAVEGMVSVLQAAPQLWPIIGDLMIRNMDWPGAQDMAERIKRTIDPKIIGEEDDNPALAAAQQQIQMLTQQLEQAMGMLQNAHNSIEARDADTKEYDAVTKRISAMNTGLQPEDVQALVLSTLRDALETSQFIGETPDEPLFGGGEGPETDAGGAMMPPPGAPPAPAAGMAE
ncbi:portal protein [Rhizorhabdus histidinilytica]|uniref:Phage P22-like portal protein n=1 Tax=Rhizorhabdus histidinilytica TaxID=439228 RepID=A0A1T5A7R5_9SPHN|nr:portal protein [Rhizorhabdus histidinilytica]SKB30960.1 Phage P22-like portal protein [Rhizorhabdus histidinilytica]